MIALNRENHATGFRLCLGYIGYAIMFAGGIVMVPLIALPLYPDEAHLAPCFIFPGTAAMLAGYLLYFMSVRGVKRGRLRRGEDAVAITGAWVVAIGVFALPFLATGNYTVSQAIFETTSGLTTTGLSIVDVTTCPHLFLLHRSMMHFFGGVGLVLVLASMVSDNGVLRIYNAEGHTDRLLPSMTDSARVILLLYTGFIVFGVVAYLLCGMPAFDAVNMAISAVSTGGFAVRAQSIGAYDSVSIQIVSIVLMLLGATNFLASYLLLKGNAKAFIRHAETKAFYGVVIGFSLLASMILLTEGFSDSIPDALLASTFHVVSTITTTGFQTVSAFSLFPSSVLLLLLMLMFMGSEAGSTAGGMKMYRIVVIAKSLFWSLRDRFGAHRNVYSHKISRFGKRIECSEDERWGALAFAMLYVGMFVAGSLVFALAGGSLGDAMFEFASCLGNVGIGVGFITAESSSAVLLTASAGMLLGRLEIIPIFIGVWKMGAFASDALHREKGRSMHHG